MKSIPETVASAERSFSKLKIIKIFALYKLMSQQRLSGLAAQSIENDICKNVPKDDIYNLPVCCRKS